MFLPTTIKEVRALGWDYIDVILFTADAYIDHPAFGAAVIGRLLEAEGYRVAIVPQPNWRDDLRDFKKLGAPRLFFGVSGGAMDSMVNHYTANIRLRSNDAYTAGGKAGFRPDHAVTVYTQILKRLYPHIPVVVGGIEASLRRLTHYDYWSDSLHPSVLVESGADLLIYGMGERVVQQVARAMRNGYNAKLLRKINQVAFVADKSYVERLDPATTKILHSFEECQQSKRAFAANFVEEETLSNQKEPTTTLVEQVGEKYIVVTPPNTTLSTEELDHSFDLPYERAPHPRYRGKGDIPAWEMIKHSINIHRGCFGGCAFCTISAHQGKFINSRSERSILKEVERVTQMPDFRGYLSDVGAPSANMYRMG
ncbi:MAG: YgiQ family radical SAM protein, partial [Alistipes sp.]|nr:YgiQ family radical SAM protein [Alistipes sp.]